VAEYAAYVYPAYIAVAIVLVGVLAHALRQRRARRAELAILETQNPGRGRMSSS
jgi:heme exporter protein CcmD